MKPKLLLLLLFALLQAYVHAQEIITLPANANLDSLSNAYLAVCDDQCLVLDAVKDKLIQPSNHIISTTVSTYFPSMTNIFRYRSMKSTWIKYNSCNTAEDIQASK